MSNKTDHLDRYYEAQAARRLIAEHPELAAGNSVTGIFIYEDRARGQVVLKLLKGARGRLSIFEIPDKEFERLCPGMLISAVVERVEVEAHGQIYAILRRETFQQTC